MIRFLSVASTVVSAASVIPKSIYPWTFISPTLLPAKGLPEVYSNLAVFTPKDSWRENCDFRIISLITAEEVFVGQMVFSPESSKTDSLAGSATRVTTLSILYFFAKLVIAKNE